MGKQPEMVKIETSLELDGAECERVIIQHTKYEYDKETLKATLPAYVEFKDHHNVYIEGRVDKEALLALLLILEEED